MVWYDDEYGLEALKWVQDEWMDGWTDDESRRLAFRKES